jgi:hypothetical protein
MQKTPDQVHAGGAEPIRSLSDRLWWKRETSDLRAVATKLTAAELAVSACPSRHSGGEERPRTDDLWELRHGLLLSRGGLGPERIIELAALAAELLR